MIKYFSIAVIIVSCYLFYINYSISHGPGVMAANPPEISNVDQKEPIHFKGAILTPKRKISGEVRIIEQKRYYFDDYSQYSPADILVGWDQLSDERNLNHLFFALQERGYRLRITKLPLEKSLIYQQTDLWTLIPANQKVKENIHKLRSGNIIKISGLLVDLNDSLNYELFTSVQHSTPTNNHRFVIWVQNLYIR